MKVPEEINRCCFLFSGLAKGAWKCDGLCLEEACFVPLYLNEKSELTQEPFQ